SPTGLVTGMAQGNSSLLSNTVYAISDAASKFTNLLLPGYCCIYIYDDQAVSHMEKHQATVTSDNKGEINEVLEVGLTGLLQSPVSGAEKHGLPGVLSGVALGITGLVAKPAAMMLLLCFSLNLGAFIFVGAFEKIRTFFINGLTGLLQSPRSMVSPVSSQSNLKNALIWLPRPLSHEHPLKPYSWEEAVGISVLLEAEDGLKIRDEKLVACKALKES
ncbi:hypothetical protein S245_053829, partial [Arachis hypogaea]